MGAWGPGIFSDDTASDIRGDYRELLEDQVSDDEATRRVIAAYQHLDADEEHVLWLALAATQSQVGRLCSDVAARALEVIDSGSGLQLWQEAGPRELAKREAALAKLREKLTGPQPPRKAVRRPWRHETDLLPGDVLSFSASTGHLALLRVLRVDEHRVGAAPIVERLDWSGQSVPSGWRLRRLKPRSGTGPMGGPRRMETYRIGRYRKKDEDWADVDFTVVARLAPRPEDAGAQPVSYTNWRGVARILEQQLT